MRLIIQDTADDASCWTARHIADRIRRRQRESDAPFVLGLPTGSTPEGTYRELIRLHRAGELSFANVVTFNMDEYVGLPADHPLSYHAFMCEHLFRHVDLRPEHTHLLDGAAPDPELECARYERLIAEAGGIDLFLGGVGEDGHLAFNEPFSSLCSRTRVKTLTEDTRRVNARFFGGDIDRVPRQALTVGVATVLEAREVVVLALGRRKARAVQQCVEGPYSHTSTVTALQTHPHGIVVCDDEAATELRVSTYRYFKEMEREQR